MHTAIIHIGSNIGKREKYLTACKIMLQEYAGNITLSSSVHETVAWGKTDQADFLNQAFILETGLNISDLLTTCQKIEQLLGRTREERWGPRTMDVDIIFYDDLVLDSPDIQVPHPRMHLRNFVLEPIAEIAPNYIHPIFFRSMLELRESCKDTSHVSV